MTNPIWQEFLAQQGATLAEGVVQHFGDLDAELASAAQGTVLCDLGQFGTLRVSGDDAQSFLQNLLSNDIGETASARAQLSSFNTPKGRMLASLMVWREDAGYLVQLPRALTEPMRKKLGMYVLRSKVKIADASDEIVSLGLAGKDAHDILNGQFGELPEESFGVVYPSASAGSTGNTRCSVIKIGEMRFQINAGVQQAQAVWRSMGQRGMAAGSSCWDWLNIRSGIPVILPQTQEEFVAQMVNYDLIGGVSFKKGCYPGQEIVARMQYLGHLKRRMYLAHIDTGQSPQAGDELFSADMQDQPSGMVVNAAPAPGGGCDVLAVVQIASRESQMLHWKSADGEALQFLPLPYSLPPS